MPGKNPIFIFCSLEAQLENRPLIEVVEGRHEYYIVLFPVKRFVVGAVRTFCKITMKTSFANFLASAKMARPSSSLLLPFFLWLFLMLPTSTTSREWTPGGRRRYVETLLPKQSCYTTGVSKNRGRGLNLGATPLTRSLKRTWSTWRRLEKGPF